MKAKLYMFCVLLFTFCACEESNRFPQIVITGEVTEIDKTGARLNAKFINTTDEEITEYGFIWGFKNDLSKKIVLSGTVKDGVFSYKIESALNSGVGYYTKAFIVKNGDYIYGATVGFESLGTNPPVINGFLPKSAWAGDTITISGNYFSLLNSENQVSLGDNKLIPCYSDINQIKVLIPYSLNAAKGIISVEVTGIKANSTDILTIDTTWIDEDNIHLNDYTEYPFINGFYLNENLYMRYVEAYDGLFKYDLNTKSIVKKTDYPCYDPGNLFSINDKGYLLLATYASCDDHIMQYDPVLDQWFEKRGFPGQLREGAVLFVIGDNAYFGGGKRTSTTVRLNDFWKYDSKNDAWSRIADFPGDGRIKATSFVYNNKAYVGLGSLGTSSTTKFNDIWEYDPEINEWKLFTTYPGTSENGIISIVLNDKLYVGQDEYWEYGFSTGKWRRIGDLQGSAIMYFKHNDSVYIISRVKRAFSLLKLNRN